MTKLENTHTHRVRGRPGWNLEGDRPLKPERASSILSLKFDASLRLMYIKKVEAFFTSRHRTTADLSGPYYDISYSRAVGPGISRLQRSVLPTRFLVFRSLRGAVERAVERPSICKIRHGLDIVRREVARLTSRVLRAFRNTHADEQQAAGRGPVRGHEVEGSRRYARYAPNQRTSRPPPFPST